TFLSCTATSYVFFFNQTPTPEISTLSLHDALPISRRGTIEAPLGRDRHDPLRHSLDTDTPRAAVTHFEVEELLPRHTLLRVTLEDRKSTRLNSSHRTISYAVFCLKKKKIYTTHQRH